MQSSVKCLCIKYFEATVKEMIDGITKQARQDKLQFHLSSFVESGLSPIVSFCC
mgnify:FL=1